MHGIYLNRHIKWLIAIYYSSQSNYFVIINQLKGVQDMKTLLVVVALGALAFFGLKRYQKHVNKAPNIEY